MSFSCDHSMDGSFPPSPAEDRGSKRLSWGRLLQRLAEIKGVHQSLSAAQGSRSGTGSVADISVSESEDSVLGHPLEETLATEVVETIAEILSDTSHHALGCSKLTLPDCLLHTVGKELLHLADSEPCGLRGALIDLCVEQGDQGSLCSLDQIAVDASLVPTFHVTLVLRPEAGGLWPKVQKIFKRNKSPQTQSANARHHQGTLRLGASFRAIKRKLYSSGELVIEECC
ncbi:DNA damage-inducible transcript 4 protein-like [Diretmus argenteus]